VTLLPPRDAASRNNGDFAEAELTEDAFLGGRLRLRQPAAGYRAAIDPVLLAAAVPAAAGDSVADLGCGVATAGLCLLARVPGARVSGLELQAPLADLAIHCPGTRRRRDWLCPFRGIAGARSAIDVRVLFPVDRPGRCRFGQSPGCSAAWPLVAESREAVSGMITALARIGGDQFAIDRINKKYYDKMLATPDAESFIMVTRPIKSQGISFRDLARDIAATDTLDAFMKEFRTRYDPLSGDSRKTSAPARANAG